VQIDEPLLRNIAKKTGGSYFRATGNSSLQTVFNEIDKLEKTKFINTEYNQKTEKYYNWLLAGFILLIIEILLRYTWLKTTT
jgi:Ca-activated chloride channel family protein